MADDMRHQKLLDYYRVRASDALQVWDNAAVPQFRDASEMAYALRVLLAYLDQGDDDDA